MTVGQLKREMTGSELRKWAYFFSDRPLGAREDLRTYYMLQCLSGSKDMKPGDVFPSLAIIEKRQMADEQYKIHRANKHPFIQRVRQMAADQGMHILGDPNANNSENLRAELHNQTST